MVQKAKDATEEFHTATPYLSIAGAAAALEFYKAAFDAEELMRHADPDGKIRHAQFRIGDSLFMLSTDGSRIIDGRFSVPGRMGAADVLKHLPHADI